MAWETKGRTAPPMDQIMHSSLCAVNPLLHNLLCDLYKLLKTCQSLSGPMVIIDTHSQICEVRRMSEVDKIQNRIRAVVLEGRMSKRELARRAGVVSGALTGMEDDDWNPTASTLKKLLEAIRRRPLADGDDVRRSAA